MLTTNHVRKTCWMFCLPKVRQTDKLNCDVSEPFRHSTATAAASQRKPAELTVTLRIWEIRFKDLGLTKTEFHFWLKFKSLRVLIHPPTLCLSCIIVFDIHIYSSTFKNSLQRRSLLYQHCVTMLYLFINFTFHCLLTNRSDINLTTGLSSSLRMFTNSCTCAPNSDQKLPRLRQHGAAGRKVCDSDTWVFVSNSPVMCDSCPSCCCCCCCCCLFFQVSKLFKIKLHKRKSNTATVGQRHWGLQSFGMLEPPEPPRPVACFGYPNKKIVIILYIYI